MKLNSLTAFGTSEQIFGSSHLIKYVFAEIPKLSAQ